MRLPVSEPRTVLPAPKLPNLNRYSCHRERHHPCGENFIARSSLPRIQEALRQGSLPVREDAH